MDNSHHYTQTGRPSPDHKPAAGGAQGSGKTCDNCRKRKIKCIEEDPRPGGACEGCRKLQLDCTYDYVKKKPGRKNTFAIAAREQQAQLAIAAGLQAYPFDTHSALDAGLAGSTNSLGGPSRGASLADYAYFSNPANALPGNDGTFLDPILRPSLSTPTTNRHSYLGNAANDSLRTSLPDPGSAIPDFLSAPAAPNRPGSTGVSGGGGGGSGGGGGGRQGGSATRSSSQNPFHISSFAFSPSDFRADPGLNWLDSILDPTGGYGEAHLLGSTGGAGILGPGGVKGNNHGTDAFGFVSDQAHLLSLESPEHGFPGSASFGPPPLSAGPASAGSGLNTGAGASSFGPNGTPIVPSPNATANLGANGLLSGATHSGTNNGTGISTGNSNGAGAGGGGGSNGPASLSQILNPNHNPAQSEPQLEDVTSWANISHFISLFLQYLYPLLPLVHRPTFAEHLATRRDLRDMDFRALLLSIVAYVISQLPTSRLVNDQFDIEGLKRLQRRCHRTCRALQRTYYGPTNLTQVTTIVFDMFYLLSIGLGHTAGARLGQAIQLAFSMGMHSDAKTENLGLDSIEIQLRRRVFWQLYASDKTRAIPGPPMLINDYQGVPSLPAPVDDDFITSQGMFTQPAARTSVLAGFVCLSKIFRVLSECFFHHRLVLSDMNVPTVGLEWTTVAEDRLHKVLREMPVVIQDPAGHPNGPARQVFGMQRANILITAAICKFALYDLRAALNVDEDQLARERETNAREIHSLLMNIPVEDLASNGESVRAKVFHIACALCAHAGPNDSDQELIRDWCNMFSAITFVQMPPPSSGVEVIDSRAGTPPADMDTENQSTGAHTIGAGQSVNAGSV